MNNKRFYVVKYAEASVGVLEFHKIFEKLYTIAG